MLYTCISLSTSVSEKLLLFMTPLSTRHAENSFFNTGLLLEEKQHPHTLIISLVYVIKFSLYIFLKSGLLQALN